jgi:RNA polymerase sigma factor (sigma-70 family)
MIIELLDRKKVHYTDCQVVRGLHGHDRRTEEWFYHEAKRYFDDHFRQVFFDEDQKQEIFQTAFVKLWSEMDNGRITVIADEVCRQQQNGEWRTMTCSLNTFLMAFARTEHRELVRRQKEDTYPEFEDTVNRNQPPTTMADEETPEDLKNRIIDDCISQLSPRCADILTMFYYQQMTLDQIMEQRPENTSKNGLKTAKNKCMNTLRERVAAEFRKLNLKA